MKPKVNLVSVFEKKQDENGDGYHRGALDPALFKKAKGEIHFLLMKGSMLPISLIGDDPGAQENLFMFVEEKKKDENSAITLNQKSYASNETNSG